MKTLKAISLVMVLLLDVTAFLSPGLEAQSNVRVVKNIYVDKQLARAAGDSTYTDISGAPISLSYPLNGPISEIRGQWPDSIRVVSYANGDSTCTVKIRWKAAFKTSTTYTTTVIDSAYAATAVIAVSGKTLSNSHWQNYDKWGLSLITTSGNTVTNALNAATAAKISIVLELWYHKPGSR